MRALVVAGLLLFSLLLAPPVEPASMASIGSDTQYRVKHYYYWDWRRAQQYRNGDDGPAGDDGARFYFTDDEVVSLLTKIMVTDWPIHFGKYYIATGIHPFKLAGTGAHRYNAAVMKHWRRLAYGAGLGEPIFYFGGRFDVCMSYNPTGAGTNSGGAVCSTYDTAPHTGAAPYTYDEDAACAGPGGSLEATDPFTLSCWRTGSQELFDALDTYFPSPRNPDPRLDSKTSWSWRNGALYDTGPDRMLFYAERFSVCEIDGTTGCDPDNSGDGINDSCDLGHLDSEGDPDPGPGGICSTAVGDVHFSDAHPILDVDNSTCTDWWAAAIDNSIYEAGCRPNAAPSTGAKCVIGMTLKPGAWRNAPYDAAGATTCTEFTGEGVLNTNTPYSYWRPGDDLCGVPSKYYPTPWGPRGFLNGFNNAWQALVTLTEARGFNLGEDLWFHPEENTSNETCGAAGTTSIDGCWLHWQTRSSKANWGGRSRGNFSLQNSAYMTDTDAPEAFIGLSPAFEHTEIHGRDIGTDTAVTFDVSNSRERGNGPDPFAVGTPGSFTFYDDDDYDVTSETTLKLTSDGVSDCTIANLNTATTIECNIPATSGVHRVRGVLTDDAGVKASAWLWIRRD